MKSLEESEVNVLRFVDGCHKLERKDTLTIVLVSVISSKKSAKETCKRRVSNFVDDHQMNCIDFYSTRPVKLQRIAESLQYVQFLLCSIIERENASSFQRVVTYFCLHKNAFASLQFLSFASFYL